MSQFHIDNPDVSATRCPCCQKLGRWRSGVGFEHEMRCGACSEVWEPGPVETHRFLVNNQDYFRALEFMGSSRDFESPEQFIAPTMQWLSKKIGDLHVEYHEDDGWQVATCLGNKGWEGWIPGDSLAEALCNAVLKMSKR